MKTENESPVIFISQQSVFDRNKLSPLPHAEGDVDRHKFLGCSAYPAILLYSYTDSEDIYGHIPHEWVDFDEPLLLVDQITKGVGVRELWWDPGAVVSQDLVQFKRAGLSKIILVAPQLDYRGLQGSSYTKSYANSVLWSTNVSTRIWIT
jgi:hypothetical protein